MCIVGGKRFVSGSVNSSLTGSLERKCSSLCGEEFEVKQQKWYVCCLFSDVWLSKLDFCMWLLQCGFGNVMECILC